MFYRRLLPFAAGAVALASGIMSIVSPGGSETRYSGARLNDNGLKNYTFVDTKRFELMNATVFLRHGARTPNYFVDSKFDTPDWENGLAYVDMLPEINFDADVWELPSKKLIDEDRIMDDYIENAKAKGRCHWGQLTLVGQEQSIAFGKELKRIYIQGYQHVHQEFNENEIYCRSTKFPRTFYTLKGILAGVYGTKAFDICNRPIIHIMATEADPLFPNAALCPALSKFMVSGIAEIIKDPEVIKMKCLLKEILGVEALTLTSSNKKVLKQQKECEYHKVQPENTVVTKIEDPTKDDYVPIYAVRDDLYSRQVHEFTVPNEFPLLLPEINRLASEEILYEYLGGSVEWEDRISILVSPAINFLKNNMKTIIDNSGIVTKDKGCISDMRESLTKKKATMKMQLLSCHDTTLIPLLVCFRMYDGQWPVFMANLIVELYREKTSNNLFARIVYNGKVQPPKMSEDTCGLDNEYLKMGMIPYADFLKFLDVYSFPDDKYVSACDKALKLFTAGKPVKKDQFI